MTDPRNRTTLASARERLGAGTTSMVVGTLVAAVAAYVFQLVVGRTLGPTNFAPITVLWTIQFLVFTTVYMPMEQLTIRRLSVATPQRGPWGLFGSVIVVTSTATVIFSALTLDRLFADDPAFLPITAVLMLSYGAFAVGRGYLAGRRRFHDYGVAIFAESMVRLALAILVLALGAGSVGVGWTLVAGALVIWFWRPFRGERSRERASGVSREQGAAGALATFVTANAASQTIVAAGPLVVSFLNAPLSEVAIFFETFLLARAPLTVSYNLISRVLPPLVRLIEEGRAAVLRIWTIRAVIGGALAGAASYVIGTAIGPELVALLLGEEFRPEPTLAGYAAAGVALATVALFSQQALIAMQLTGRLASAWLAGLVVAAAAIAVFTDGSASLRVGRAFLIGEAVAFVGLAAAVIIPARSRTDSPA